VNRKETIYKTGLRLFSAQGYEATTTLQIAREVGVTEPAVFFTSKTRMPFFPRSLKRLPASISATLMTQRNHEAKNHCKNSG